MKIKTQEIITSIAELFQLILVFNEESGECRALDFNPEMANLPENPDAFSEFYEALRYAVHPEDRPAFEKFSDPKRFRAELNDKASVSIESRIKQNNFRYYWSEITLLKSSQDVFYILLRDIHERKMRELRILREKDRRIREFEIRCHELMEENLKDELTGLYNPKGISEFFSGVVKEAERTDGAVFLCMADLDGLKYINDTFGHEAGNEVIRAAADTLRRAAPEGACSVRFGGDEFVLFAAAPKGSGVIAETERRIDEGVKSYNAAHAGAPYELGICYGSVLEPYSAELTEPDALIIRADNRMYKMKKRCAKHMR